MRNPRSAAAVLRGLAATKLYWGMVAVIVVGALLSPTAFDGSNIFLSPANLTDVLRQVSITGIVAVGMTLVILTGGIDLSVGSVMALSATLVAMLLTQPGWNHGAYIAAPCVALVFAVLGRVVAGRLLRRAALAWVIAIGTGAAAYAVFAGTVTAGFGVAGVLIATLCVGLTVGAVSGQLVAKGGLQPFIATLAMMVTALGLARVMAGEDQSVYPIYPGTNAPIAIDALRAAIWGVPVPGLIFLAVVLGFAVLLARFRFGREVYAIGGNEKAAHLAGINVARVKLTVYALSGALAALAGLLYAAQYRQGKPDAGTGLELDAIAAVVIGGASLAGGRGTVTGTLVGVLIFGFLTNIFQLCNVDSNTQLILKGIIIVAAVLLQEGRRPRLPQWIRKGSPS